MNVAGHRLSTFEIESALVDDDQGHDHEDPPGAEVHAGILPAELGRGCGSARA